MLARIFVTQRTEPTLSRVESPPPLFINSGWRLFNTCIRFLTCCRKLLVQLSDGLHDCLCCWEAVLWIIFRTRWFIYFVRLTLIIAVGWYFISSTVERAGLVFNQRPELANHISFMFWAFRVPVVMPLCFWARHWWYCFFVRGFMLAVVGADARCRRLCSSQWLCAYVCDHCILLDCVI